MRKIAMILFSGVLVLTFLSACAAPLQYDKITLGMSREDVKKIAGKPSRVLEGETTGEGAFVSKAGKYEIWLYRGGALIFSEDKLIDKAHKGKQ